MKISTKYLQTELNDTLRGMYNMIILLHFSNARVIRYAQTNNCDRVHKGA